MPTISKRTVESHFSMFLARGAAVPAIFFPVVCAHDTMMPCIILTDTQAWGPEIRLGRCFDVDDNDTINSQATTIT